MSSTPAEQQAQIDACEPELVKRIAQFERDTFQSAYEIGRLMDAAQDQDVNRWVEAKLGDIAEQTLDRVGEAWEHGWKGRVRREQAAEANGVEVNGKAQARAHVPAR